MDDTRKKNHARRKFLKDGVTAVFGAGCIRLAAAAEGKAGHHSLRPDEPNTHNMLVVGRETVYLSHLPMFSAPDFDSPHRYQVILEASFSKVGSNAQAVYFNDRKTHPQTRIYTLNPEEFILPNLISPNANPTLGKFKGNVFRGHFEKPGKRLLIADAEVSIKNVIHFREFDSNAANLAQLEYLLFGKGKELFLAHFITRPPDFDQVLSVTVTDHTFTDEELRKGLRVVFSKPNTVTQRVLENQEATGEIKAMGGDSGPLKVKVKAGMEFYFEEGELRVPATFKTTAAERLAKFP